MGMWGKSVIASQGKTDFNTEVTEGTEKREEGRGIRE
jgi:hypothetical protein